MVRHSHEDALTTEEYQRLLRTAICELQDRYATETHWILIAAGRLGMRGDEITHMREDWIDWEREQIRIPSFQACSCGACRQSARQSVGYHPEETDMEAEMERRWSPKTETSARAIPFAFDDYVRRTVESFWEDRDEFPLSRSAINRRVDRLLDAADLPQDYVYPHALRATSATYHAYRGLPAAALQSLHGWSDITTAQKYIRLSGGATAQALEKIHSD